MQSPCRRCGKSVSHTRSDLHPLCDFCEQRRVYLAMLGDIASGKLEVPDSLIEELTSLRNAQAEE